MMSFQKNQLKDNMPEILGLSDFSHEDLQHEKQGPSIIQTYRNLSIEKSQTDGYYIFLMDYVHSPFPDFESYPRMFTGLNEDDIQLMVEQFNSKFLTYKVFPRRLHI